MRFAPKTEKEIAESNLLPEGTYSFEVTEAVDYVSKKGNEMIKMFVKVYKPDGTSISVTDYLAEAMLYKVLHFCQATGLEELYHSGEIQSDSEGRIQEFIGKTGELKLGIQKSDDYPDRNTIKDYVVGEAKKANKAAAKKQANMDAQKPVEIDDEIPF